MLMTDIPRMFVSEKSGWEDIDRSRYTHRWFFRSVVMPLSLLPPALYVYAELMHPGAIFPLSVPALTGTQLLVVGIVFYAMQLAMVGYMAMLIQRMALGRDHDPGYDGAYALAAIAPVPLWLSSLSLLVPSTGFVMGAVLVAWAASIALLRHGVRPLLHIRDAPTARYVADVVTLAGVAAWIALLVVAGLIFSVILSWWAI
ncbi:MAG TPA: YIP1 family protein [Azospira sp.]|nr:YIP1 family protein [Azospira sp.]